MRHFQLPSSNPLFQQESLQLLKDMQAGYEPALVPELQDYVVAQASFIVKEASEYRSSANNWPALLAAGQRAFIEIWQESQAKQQKLPVFIQTEIVEGIRAVATSQLAGHTTPENLMTWAREAGESDAVAAAFAEYHRTKSADYEQDMAEEVTRFSAKEPADEEESAEKLENLAEVAKETVEIPATVLSWAWAYIEKYKAALVRGHRPEWADTYARHFYSTDDESGSERAAYQRLQELYPNPETATPDLRPEPGSSSYYNQDWINKAVYQEAYAVRLDRGPEYADAYARTVGLGSYEIAETYAKAFAKQRRAGKSELFADYYASEVSNDIDPRYAILEAELYEQALANGMAEGWAQQYADRLSTNLIEYAETDEDQEHYRQEAAEYIARKQRKEREARAD
ncbi:MAG: hypothetical protein EOO60_03990 [Hymenobacter sp.]|nr:MAG: hypothetical protein EOO60_03990 [Hymenobacter sp.]